MLSFSGLRASILLQLIFLIVAAMLLVNVVMIKLSEGDILQSKVVTGRLLVQAVAQNVDYQIEHKNTALKDLTSNIQFVKNMMQLLTNGGFDDLVIIDKKGETIFQTDPSGTGQEYGISLARESMATASSMVRYSGSTWGVLWLSHRDISISAPLTLNGRTLGGVVVSASLRPMYDRLRDSEKIILLYILLDTIILAIVGIYLLSRIVIKPIYKLLAMTEEYQDGYEIPSFSEISKNEIGNLSRSLSMMLKRLDENKKELQDHITSLEKANVELQNAQDEIIRSEKLASVGRLSAGIAHEIGNPIGIILGYLDLIKKGNINEAEKSDFFNRVESEIIRVNDIIKQLLDFSRPSSGKSEKCHAHELIRSAVYIMRPQPMMEAIHIQIALDASKDEILVDPNYLQQVFLNIIMNAADALTIQDTSVDEHDYKVLAVQSKNTDSFIEIQFKDNGPGISEEELDHIFDPFYTTKDPGQGTGLGLSVSYRIIESYGGTIIAESHSGEGTTIIVKLPIHEDGE